LHGWRGIESWSVATTGRPWPEKQMYLDYMISQAAEPCGKTVLKAAVLSLRFLERACGLSPDERYGDSPEVSNLLKELEIQVACATGASSIRQAPSFTVSVVVALELAVCDADIPKYLRGLAWVRLIKLWASLRFSDVQWTSPASLVMDAQGLTGTLSRTKTSGVGKSVLSQPFYVASDSWIASPTWLLTGLHIWQDFGGDRDYLVPVPTADREGIRAVLAEYRDISALSQELFQHFRLPTFLAVDDGVGQPYLDWSSGEDPLLLPGAGCFWTEHSERNGLISWASALGYRSEEVRLLGRWAPSSSDLYVRTARVMIMKIQSYVAKEIRLGLFQADLFQESGLLTSFEAYLAAAGWADSVVAAAVAGLRFFNGFSGGPTAPPLRLEEAVVTASPTEVATVLNTDSGCEGEVLPQLGEYFVTCPGKGLRRLHMLGSCALRPGIDCGRFLALGGDYPDKVYFDARCRKCWQGTAGEFLADSSETAATSSASSIASS
jgi:hypothetical protein